MDAGKTDALVLPVPPQSFVLIVGVAMQGSSADTLETALRHMGLRLERVDIKDADIAAGMERCVATAQRHHPIPIAC